jgi:hypothetical protein
MAKGKFWIKLSRKVNNRWVAIRCMCCDQILKFKSFKAAEEYKKEDDRRR